jgi:predicted MPP superfamily phosphohydrolase
MHTLLVFLIIVDAVSARLRVAFLSDLHVGESCQPIPYNGTDDCACIANDRRAIARINALSPPVDAVIITGDITSSAWPSQFSKAYSILSELGDDKWYPMLGNHDVWTYDREGGNETSGPYGDALFGATFGRLLQSSANVSGYHNLSVHNPLYNTTSTFQNFQLTLLDKETGAKLAFFAGDWSTRQRAPCANCSGVPGWAERGLSNFPGGTLPWLRAQLAAEAAKSPTDRADRLFLIQHQPLSCPFYMPDFLFCFGAEDKLLLSQTMTEAWPKSAWFGVFAGHLHVFDNVTVPFADWPEFREVETSAAKGDAFDADEASAVTLVEFAGVDIEFIEMHSYSLSSGTWTVRRGQ